MTQITKKVTWAPDKKGQNELKTSENFPDSPTSDLILQSCDNVLFYIHIRNLSVHSSVFADDHDWIMADHSSCAFELVTKPRETVDTTETAKTLELLLQFIYPRPQPDLAHVEFTDLVPLAEAAEKWKIYAAMTPCNMVMRVFVDLFPLQILKYATLHGYNQLMCTAAKLTLDLPSDEVFNVLPPAIFIRWVIYRDKIRLARDTNTPKWLPPPDISGNLKRGAHAKCDRWDSFVAAVKPFFNSCVEKLNISDLFCMKRFLVYGCPHCESRLKLWHQQLVEIHKWGEFTWPEIVF